VSSDDKIKDQIRELARSHGFSACGFAKAGPLDDHAAAFKAYLESGFQGDMNWLSKNLHLRLNPTELVPGAHTVVSLLAPYYHPENLSQPGSTRVSRYAQGLDYHKVLRKKGKQLLRDVAALLPGTSGRFFTDSGPVMEKEWARRAGLGWIGKNACLIHPGAGSWFFLSELILDCTLEPDPPFTTNHCGHCTRCLDACPTGALLGDGRVDARKCISYLTIEYEGDLHPDTHPVWQDWIFGCDVCQEVCPHNKREIPAGMPEFAPVPALSEALTSSFEGISSELFDEQFKDSPLRRTGIGGLRRNSNHVATSAGRQKKHDSF